MEQAKEITGGVRQDAARYRPQCEKCFGLCCTALYFSKAEGFPADKRAGVPCAELDAEFRCKIHEKLGATGLRGCIAYECFGAGQLVSQTAFLGQSWRAAPSAAEPMFRTFLILQQVCEIGWHLCEASTFPLEEPVVREVGAALARVERIARYTPQALAEFDLAAYHAEMGGLFRKVSGLVRGKIAREKGLSLTSTRGRRAGPDYFGKDLRKKDLRCADLRGACLIAANLEGADLTGADLLGADLRGANLKGTDLSDSIFLTQPQISSAAGNAFTRLPPLLTRPFLWEE